MITGTQNPMVGQDEFYQYTDSFDPFNSSNATYVWNIWKKQSNGNWVDVTTKSPKIRQKVPFKFFEKVIGIEFKLQLFKSTKKLLSNDSEIKLAGEMIVIPKSAKTPKIDRVVLFNQGAKDPNKASYKDALIARAYCVAMFNQEVEFRLWEDDAAGKGHNAEINKNNQLPQVFKAKVNEKGIAEVKISLLSNEKVLRAIANKYMISGDQSEGENHEYYVTASYAGKIHGASQVNVDVANPDDKTKPKETSAIFPGTSRKPQKPDAESKITNAYFVDSKGNPTQKIKIGANVCIRVKSNNMLGDYIKYTIWEYDRLNSDKIFQSNALKITADSCSTPFFQITQKKFDEGIDLNFPYSGDPDKDGQEYYIEITPLGSKAKSVSFGVDDEAKRTTVENVRSPALVKNKLEKTDSGGCPRCKIPVTAKNLEKIFPDATYADRKTAADTYTKYMKALNMDNCWNKAHFFAQSIVEGGKALNLKDGEKMNYSADDLFKGRWDHKTKKYRIIFSYYHNNQEAYVDGRTKDHPANKQEIANKAYADKNRSAKYRVGNTQEGDGWRFRGRGLIQLTGRGNYSEANNYTLNLAGQNIIDSDKGAELVGTDISIAILTSMAYFNFRKNKKTGTPLYKIALKCKDVRGKICPEIGENVTMGKSTNYDEKQKAFDNITSEVFRIDECLYGKVKKEDTKSSGKCPEDCSQCFEYSDVVENPKLNNQSDNVNKNRWHRTKRYNSNHPAGYYHTGTDILAQPGTTVFSMLCGTVTKDINTSLSTNQYIENSLGNYVVIKSKDKNGENVYIKYCHLDKVSVAEGQKVKHGEKIGESGSTGNAAAVYKNGILIHGIYPQYRHVHIEAATSSSFGNTRVDAEKYMKTKFDETTKGKIL